MADKYLKVGTEGPEEIEATVTSTGVANAGDIPALNSSGKIDESMMPNGIGADVKVVPASENLSAGDFVNLWNDGGSLKCRKADASGGFAKEAHGYVKSAVSTAANATVYFDGTNSNLTGLTIGAKYYLSATAGTVTTTIPTTSGHIAQALGVATSATEMTVEIMQSIKRA